MNDFLNPSDYYYLFQGLLLQVKDSKDRITCNLVYDADKYIQESVFYSDKLIFKKNSNNKLLEIHRFDLDDVNEKRIYKYNYGNNGYINSQAEERTSNI
ncbi:MAG: hypothetical protein EPN82_07705 [Bacteroidetes bacterium]|nr:MAG: hypothetical protein EPN82_07705 [Bacteroidota bacterium]